MTLRTDFVFVTRSRDEATRFADIVEQLYDGFDYVKFRPEPANDNGPVVSSTTVFHFGLYYVTPELIDALREEPWSPEAVLWILSEAVDLAEIRIGEVILFRAARP